MEVVTLRVERSVRRHEGVAAMGLFNDAGSRICELDIQYSLLAPLRNQNVVALEFVVIASAVYALDKSFLRDSTTDAWTREFSLTLPVTDPSRWKRAGPDLTETLEFLTGDRWHLEFTSLMAPLTRMVRTVRRRRADIPVPIGPRDKVCLFSGGLDSLVGAIDHLETSASQLLLIGHHDGHMAGPFADQRGLIEPLRTTYPRRLRPVFLRVGQNPAGEDITLRSRSLLFIALGIYGATAAGSAVPVLIPENGTIALNFPLTPSRRGSCSTRTAHPHYLNTLGRALARLGIGNPLVNPLGGMTKGEVVAKCANLALLRRLAPVSVSCAKRSRRGNWVRTTAKSCGQCMPCMYRRAALHRIGADTEVYGNDVCKGEVDVNGTDDAGNDFRACLSLLRRNPPLNEISNTLLASGPLDVTHLAACADLVSRTMNEIRTVLHDKGIPAVRRAAGLTK